MSAGWTYEATPPARRDIKRLDPPVRRRVIDALDRFVADPRAADIRKLSLSQWRLRVGEWRVRFSFDEERRVIGNFARISFPLAFPSTGPGLAFGSMNGFKE